MARKRKNLSHKYFRNETPTRKSSLQVNLSFVSNLSNSGDDLEKRSQLDNNDDSSLGKYCTSQRGKMSDTLNLPSTLGMQGKDIGIISSKEQALNQSCQLLKDTILEKTRKIFDQRNELTVKTTNILKGHRTLVEQIENNNVSVNSTNRSDWSKNSPIQTGPGTKSSAVTKNAESTRKGSLDSVRTASKCDTSTIVSGSSKAHCKTLSRISKKLLRVSLTRLQDPRLNFSSQSSQSSICEDIGAPITCSSFISGYTAPEFQGSQQAENDSQSEKSYPDVDTLINLPPKTPTEIITNQVPTVNKKSLTNFRRSSAKSVIHPEIKAELYSLKDDLMELTSVQSHILCGDSKNLVNTIRTAMNVNSSGMSGKENFEHELPTHENSASYSSLRVNTSLAKPECSPVHEYVHNGNEYTGTPLNKSMEESGKISNGCHMDLIENMSLIARLRDNSGGKENQYVHNRNEDPSFIDGTPHPPSRSFLWKTQFRMDTLRAIREKKNKTKDSETINLSMSNAHSTAPISVIDLDDTQGEITRTSRNTQIIPDSSDEEEHTNKIMSSMTTLENSGEKHPKQPQENVPEEIPMPSKNHPTEICRDLPKCVSTKIVNEFPKIPLMEVSNIDVDHAKEGNITRTSRTRRKKLLPLSEDLELVSFSPVSTTLPTPKKSFVRKKRRHPRRIASRAIEKKVNESKSMNDEDDKDLENIRTGTRDLRDEKAKTKKYRKIISKKIVVKRVVGADILKELVDLESNTSDRDSNSGRNSLSDFSKKNIVPIPKRMLRPRKLIIVATGFSKGDVDLIKSVVRDLGGAELSSRVSKSTTHVVSTGVRTINLLLGIIRGCWLVSLDWILKSLENRKWLDADFYEMDHFSKAVKENRRDRQLFGKAYIPELFMTCGLIYIEHGTSPPPQILKDLVKTAGGRITENIRDAQLIVGPQGLREVWILDSITAGELQPIADYKQKR